MTERKVLNKYFPPDYDPSKIPRLPRGKKNRVFNLRTMAPFNMRCNTCKTYIYKARKFNSRMEPVDNEDYLGLRIYRFYIRCPACCSEISWKTDIANNDYAIESGATRTFEATRTAYKMAIEKDAQMAEDEKNNPMLLLENRTKQSKREMDQLEMLEDLRDMNTRHASLDVSDRALDHLHKTADAKAAEEEASLQAELDRFLERQAELKKQKEEEEEASAKVVSISKQALTAAKAKKRHNPLKAGIIVKKKRPNDDAKAEKLATEVAEEKPTTEAAEEKLATEAAEEKPATEAAQEKPTSEAAGETSATQAICSAPTGGLSSLMAYDSSDSSD